MTDVAVEASVEDSPAASSISSPDSSATTASYSLAPSRELDFSDDEDVVDDVGSLKIKCGLKRLRDGQLHCERTLYFLLEKMDTVLREISVLRADSHYLKRCASRTNSLKRKKTVACSRSYRTDRYRPLCSDMVQFGYAEKNGDSVCAEGEVGGRGELRGMAGAVGVGADEVRRQQRIARYKEERRRQLAAQFGRRDAAAAAPDAATAPIRSTRASRLRSAASVTAADINGISRNGVKKDTAAKTSSPTVLSSSSESKERIAGTSPGLTSSSSPRKEHDKSAKRKSNLNRQLHSEQIVHSDVALPDDGVRRRSSQQQIRPASSGSNSSSKSATAIGGGRPWSALPTATHRHSCCAGVSPASLATDSSKRLTPPRKSERGGTPPDSGPGAGGGANPPSRIPKKISSSPSLAGSSSSRESSPRHKSSSTRLSVSTQPPVMVEVGSAVPPPSRIVNGGTNGVHSDGHKPPADRSHSSDLLASTEKDPEHPATPQPTNRWSWHTTTPVSILKRKTSQEEVQNQTAMGGGVVLGVGGGGVGVSTPPPPPVTFSPSVVDPVPSRRQGILKKHRSLDEAEVGRDRRRSSCSPHSVQEEGEEEGVAVDFRPILKHQRRSSLEELRHRTQSPEPQSILKRKTSREECVENSSAEPHSILKRKTSIVDTETNSSHITIAESVLLSIAKGGGLSPTPQTADDHVMKPILKKKSFSGEEPLIEAGSVCDVPPRPILKKKPSVDCEEAAMKPILKSRKDSLVNVASSFGGEENVAGSERETELSSVSLSPLPILKKSDNESSFSTPVESVTRLRSVFWRSSERNSAAESNSCFSKRRSLDITSVRGADGEDERPHRPCRPGSVAERIMNMESFLAAEGCGQDRPLPPKSPILPSPVQTAPGAFPKRRDRDRFLTQPITAQEISNSKSWIPGSPQPTEPGESEIDDERSWPSGTNNQQLLNDDSHCSEVNSSELSPAITIANADNEGKMADENEDSDGCNGRGGLVRSKSVSARASLFEAQMKQAAEDIKPRRFNKGSINRRSNVDGASRFATQPVTFDEVEEAKRQNVNKDAQDSPS